MSIQWGRVVLAAFLMEIVLVAIAVPLFMSGEGRVLVYVIPPAALIGIVGTLMYIGLTRAQPEPWQYWVAHGLKVVGGIAAGMVLARRQTAVNRPPSAI